MLDSLFGKKKKKNPAIATASANPLMLYVVSNYSPPPFLCPPCNSIFPWNQWDRPWQASQAQIIPDRNGAWWDGRMQRCADSEHNNCADMDQQMWKDRKKEVSAHRHKHQFKKKKTETQTQFWPSWSLVVVCLFVWPLVCTSIAKFSLWSTVCICVSVLFLVLFTTVNWTGGRGFQGHVWMHILLTWRATHTENPALFVRVEEVTGFNERWSVAVCYGGELSRSLDRDSVWLLRPQSAAFFRPYSYVGACVCDGERDYRDLRAQAGPSFYIK